MAGEQSGGYADLWECVHGPLHHVTREALDSIESGGHHLSSPGQAGQTVLGEQAGGAEKVFRARLQMSGQKVKI